MYFTILYGTLKQFLFVLSKMSLLPNRSNDPELLNSSSLYLRNQNITAITVGVTAADLTELQVDL